jgi:hypothetical protein
MPAGFGHASVNEWYATRSLWVYALDGGNPRRLAAARTFAADPTWPASRQLLLLLYIRGNGLWLINPHSGTPHESSQAYSAAPGPIITTSWTGVISSPGSADTEHLRSPAASTTKRASASRRPSPRQLQRRRPTASRAACGYRHLAGYAVGTAALALPGISLTGCQAQRDRGRPEAGAGLAVQGQRDRARRYPVE